MNKLLPFGFAAIGKSLDSLTTALYCNRFDYNNETNDLTRRYIENYGPINGLVRKGIGDQVIIAGLGIGLYVVDKLLGIENEPLNFHRGLLYGIGGLTYIAAINNSLMYTIGLIKDKQANKNCN